MKHIKTFESFKINETQFEENSGLKQKLKSHIESLSDEDKKKLAEDLNELAQKLGLSPEQMEDEEAVAAKLLKTMDSAFDSLKLKNEGFSLQGIKSWWSRTKNKVFNFLTKFGLGGVVLSIIDIAIGAEMQSHTVDTAGAEQIVDPNTAVVIGGIAAAVSIASIVIGQIGLNRK